MKALSKSIKDSMTFFADYRTGNIDAIESVGDGTATFTRTASNCTFVDANGVLQLIAPANVHRTTQNYYDTTGLHRRPGQMIEGASTNLLLNSYGSLGSGTLTSWGSYDDETNAPTLTTLDATGLINISGAQAQRCQITFSDGTYLTVGQNNTADSTVVQNDIITYSVWVKGTFTGCTLLMKIQEADSANVSGTAHNSGAISGDISATEWRRFTYTQTMVDADCARVGSTVVVSAIDATDTADFQVTGVQLEVLPFASSFIPTTSAAVERKVEGLEYVIAGNRTAATESCVVKLVPEFASSVTGSTTTVLDADTKRRSVYYAGGANDAAVAPNLTDESGTTTADLINEAWTANVSQVLGYSVQATGNPNVACYYNGAADGTDDNDDFTANAWGTDFSIGSKMNRTLPFYGTIQAIAFFSRVLTAGEHLEVYNWFLDNDTNPVVINEFGGDVTISDNLVIVSSIVVEGASAGDTVVFTDKGGTEVLRLSGTVGGGSIVWTPPKGFRFNEGLRFDDSASSLSEGDFVFVYIA